MYMSIYIIPSIIYYTFFYYTIPRRRQLRRSWHHCGVLRLRRFVLKLVRIRRRRLHWGWLQWILCRRFWLRCSTVRLRWWAWLGVLLGHRSFRGLVCILQRFRQHLRRSSYVLVVHNHKLELGVRMLGLGDHRLGLGVHKLELGVRMLGHDGQHGGLGLGQRGQGGGEPTKQKPEIENRNFWYTDKRNSNVRVSYLLQPLFSVSCYWNMYQCFYGLEFQIQCRICIN